MGRRGDKEAWKCDGRSAVTGELWHKSLWTLGVGTLARSLGGHGWRDEEMGPEHHRGGCDVKIRSVHCREKWIQRDAAVAHMAIAVAQHSCGAAADWPVT